MLRAIVGVIAGYVAVVVFIFAAFSIAYLGLGSEGAFQPGTYKASAAWIVTSFVLSFVAAVLGGYVCAIIVKDGKAPLVLACLIFIFGILAAIPVLRAAQETDGATRVGNVSTVEAMQKGAQPAWVALLNPVVGAAGVLIGARLKRKPH